MSHLDEDARAKLCDAWAWQPSKPTSRWNILFRLGLLIVTPTLFFVQLAKRPWVVLNLPCPSSPFDLETTAVISNTTTISFNQISPLPQCTVTFNFPLACILTQAYGVQNLIPHSGAAANFAVDSSTDPILSEQCNQSFTKWKNNTSESTITYADDVTLYDQFRTFCQQFQCDDSISYYCSPLLNVTFSIDLLSNSTVADGIVVGIYDPSNYLDPESLGCYSTMVNVFVQEAWAISVFISGAVSVALFVAMCFERFKLTPNNLMFYPNGVFFFICAIVNYKTVLVMNSSKTSNFSQILLVLIDLPNLAYLFLSLILAFDIIFLSTEGLAQTSLPAMFLLELAFTAAFFVYKIGNMAYDNLRILCCKNPNPMEDRYNVEWQKDSGVHEMPFVAAPNQN